MSPPWRSASERLELRAAAGQCGRPCRSPRYSRRVPRCRQTLCTSRCGRCLLSQFAANAASQREKAISFAEQVWELTYALEKRVRFPIVDLPGFSAGEIQQTDVPIEPVAAAQALRRHWELGAGRIGRMVRTMEQHGIVVTLVPVAGTETTTIDAFSTSKLPRPIVVADTGPRRRCVPAPIQRRSQVSTSDEK